MNEEYFEIPDELLKTEDEIKQRIAEKQNYGFAVLEGRVE